jgi:ABC-type Zn uptake system ZnuABC Zn-binding protein ZnuA
MSYEETKKRIETEKQIGYRKIISSPNGPLWTSIAIQKHNGYYKVYIDEILEKNMAKESYEKEDKKIFTDLNLALTYLKNIGADIENLKPLKGQRIFNPNLINP